MYSDVGDTVGDLFCGSGGISLAAIMDSRHCVAVDKDANMVSFMKLTILYIFIRIPF
jgi:DNA modification methylase